LWNCFNGKQDFVDYFLEHGGKLLGDSSYTSF
jgi:hypothetical protein